MTPNPPQPFPPATTVDALGRILASHELPPGDRAALRRMIPAQRPPLAFFRLACRALPPDWETHHREWTTVVAGMALMCPDPHRPGRAVGVALAEAGLSESRLERLLVAEGEFLGTTLLRTAYFLGAKQLPLDWTEFARLLFVTDRDERETVRLAIARDFYRPPEARPRRN